MELAADTKHIAQYSPTSTPILDVLRPLPRKRDRLSASQYFFLSSTVILTLISLPVLGRAAESISSIGMTPAFLVTLLIIPGMALGVALAAHETGHLLAGWLAGFQLAQRKYGKHARACQLYSCPVLRLGGIVALEPRKMDRLPRRLLVLVGGGPLASFSLPLFAETFLYWTRIHPFAAFAVHVFSMFSVLLGIAELLPDTGKGSFSDGSRILMLLKNDSGAQRWISIIQLQLALVRGEHPRTWNELSVTRAAEFDDDSRDALAARWLGYLWATERQDITLATKYLEDTLAAPGSVPAWLRDRLFLEAAIFQAWFRDDSAKAHFWAGRVRGNKLTPLQQLRLHIALLWSHGKLFDAWEKLGDYFSLLRGLPASPARDLVEKSALEWKAQMESRMLTRAWRAMYSMSHDAEPRIAAPPHAPSLTKSSANASW
jgi:hypothetical protein